MVVRLFRSTNVTITENLYSFLSQKPIFLNIKNHKETCEEIWMKKIFSNLYRPDSLRFRITSLVLIISVIVLVGATVFINNRAIAVIEQNSNEQLNTASSTLATTVSVWLEPHLNALKTLVSLPDIISMEADRQKMVLQKMANAYPYMYLISTTDLQGMNVARNDNEKFKDYSNREWFQKTRDGSAVTFESLIGKTSHRPALVVAMAIKNEAGRIVGVGMFATNLDHLAHQVRVTRAGKTGFAYLIDRKNRVIAHPDPVFANNLSDFSAYPPVKALRQGKRGLVSFVDEKGQHWRAYLNNLDNGWGVVVQEQEEELLSTQRLFQRVALTIIFIAGLIMMSLTWWGVTWALKPINTLTEAVKRVTSTNMSRPDFEFVRCASFNIRTKDEVGTLADSFYKMAVRLQATLVSLEQELYEHKRTEEELKKHRDRLEDLVKERTKDLTKSNERLIQEIEERKLAEQALIGSEQKYRSLYKNLRDGSAAVQLDGTITDFNPVFQVMLGYAEEEIGKLSYEDITPAKWHTYEAKIIEEQVMTRGYSDIYEKEYRRKDGVVFPVELQTYLIRDENGMPVGMWAFVRDITERKRAEEEKKRLELQLAQAQKMESIGTLAGGIAHDFNNLLTGILGNVSLALMNMDGNNPLCERLKNVEEYVQRGSELTKQLLGFARGGKYEIKPTHLGEFIRRSSEMFGRTKKEIHIHHKAQDGLWTVEVDRGQMEQVLLNLYVNAWQAMPGGGDLYLSVENVELDKVDVNPYDIEPGKFVKMTVTDVGIGMDEATKARVFEPFFTTKELGRGTGLGLASAYGIIKNHGGFINVESEKELGTSFMIYLPASLKEVDDEYTSKDEIQKGRETILLIDDEEMILDIGSKMLEGLGYKVITASGGRQGFEIYEKNQDRFDLVILDMIMPDFGGKRTFENLHKIDQSVRVLLSSGYSLDSQAEEIMQSGCKGFIQKPFTMVELSKKIRGILDEQIRGRDWVGAWKSN